MALPLILLAAGAAVSIYGSLKEGEAQANAANDAARVREYEAQEILDRLKINRESILNQDQRFQTRQKESLAASGRLTNDSTLSILEDTHAQAVREVYNTEREANFRAEGLRMEGYFAQQRGQELSRAAQIHAFGTILTTGAIGLANIDTSQKVASASEAIDQFNENYKGEPLKNNDSTLNPGNIAKTNKAPLNIAKAMAPKTRGYFPFRQSVATYDFAPGNDPYNGYLYGMNLTSRRYV